MNKSKNLQRMFRITLLAMIFGTGGAYAQLAPKNSAGQTPANEAGKMSPAGQNETSSVKPPEPSSSSGASSTSGSSASGSSATLGKENSAGKTPANEEGKMSITGQNATSSAAPPEASGASGASGSSASGSSATLGKENSAGQTPRNEKGKMSITGQNATSSAAPPKTSGSSAATGSSAAGAGAAMESKSSGSSADSSSASKAGGAMSKSDENMMKQLSYANMAEIEAGKMALEKSKDEQVKTFAQKMVDDHSKAQDKLSEIAQSKNVTLPTALDAKHKSEIAKLDKLSGDKFDKKYMAQGGVTDHRKAHDLVARVEKRAKDDELKSLASTMKPTIDEHWQMAKQMKGSHAATTGSSGSASKSKSGKSDKDAAMKGNGSDKMGDTEKSPATSK